MEVLPIVLGLGAVVFMGVNIALMVAKGAKVGAEVKERMGVYKAVIQDIIYMKGQRKRTKLFLLIETPEGPIGEYLIVPLTPSCSMTFLQDARATQRPIQIECCVDRSIEYAYRQYATVLGPA